MVNPSPLELFEAFYPDGLTAGQLVLHTTTLRRGNQRRTSCTNLVEADGYCIRYRQTRRVEFAVCLHDAKLALAEARRRHPGVRANIRGYEASVSALPAFWVEIPYRPDGANPSGDLPSYRQALDLLAGVDHRPSILINTGHGLCAFWLLERPWVFDLENDSADKAEALGLLRRLHWAIARLAAEHGWLLPAPVDLTASFPVPGSVTGDSVKGPRAELEAFPLVTGDGRFRRRDFESLPEPPAEDPWPQRALVERPAELAIVSPVDDVDALASDASMPASADVVRPRIVITCRRHEVNDQAMAVLAAGTDLFEQDGALVELVRAHGAEPRALLVRAPRLQELLSRHCDFVRETGGSEPSAVAPPRWTTRALLSRGRWPELPQLATPVVAERAADPAPRVTPARAPARASDAEDTALLAVVEEVLATLGGAATARRLAGALAAEPERSAELWPAGPPTASALGYRLRGLKDRVLGGRTLIESHRTRDGVAWAVHPSTPANHRKEAA